MTSSSLPMISFRSPIASSRCASAILSSSSSSLMLRSWSCSLLSNPGSIEIKYSICCSFVIRSCASSTWAALKTSGGCGSTRLSNQHQQVTSTGILEQPPTFLLIRFLVYFADLVIRPQCFEVVMAVDVVDACNELLGKLPILLVVGLEARGRQWITWSTAS